MAVVVIATVSPLAASRDAVAAALEQAVDSVHRSDRGCELYALHRSGEKFVIVEKWHDEAAFAAHDAGPAAATLKNALAGKLREDMSVIVATPQPWGSPALGAL